jgi:diguanylate cyclase (GGDEF)-like protein
VKEMAIEYSESPIITVPDTNALLTTIDTSNGLTQLIERLQTSLMLPELLQIFADEVANIVPINGISLETDNECFSSEQFKLEQCRFHSNLVKHQQSLGQISYASKRPLNQLQCQLLSKLQQTLFYPVKNALTFLQVQRQALYDHLTQLGNRGYFEQTLDCALIRAAKKEQALTLMVLDLDNFKQANDIWGHDQGDQVLVEFAYLIRNAIRKTDYAFRFGGDEFAIVLEGANELVATRIAKQISLAVAQSQQLNQVGVSCSIGYACRQQSDDRISLFKRADTALYKAKNAGKNSLRRA